tara:strand:+ start:113 stop:322 length:210 start_codon:yes stop_codon:yes gene_type:complete
MVEVLETLDDFEDDSYGAFLDYSVLMQECEFEPRRLLIDAGHPYYEEMKTFAQADKLEVIATEGVTKIC